MRKRLAVRRTALIDEVVRASCPKISGTVNFAHPAGANGRFDSIWAQPGARRQVHRAANYKLGTTQRTAPQPTFWCGQDFSFNLVREAFAKTSSGVLLGGF